MIKRFLSGHEHHLKAYGIKPIENITDVQQTAQPDKKLKILPDKELKILPDKELKIQDTQQPDSTGYAGKSISGFYFNGTKHQVDTWKGLLIKMLEIIYSKHGKDFNKILNMPGKKRQYFSYDSQKLDLAQKFDDTNIYMETKLGSNTIVKLCFDVIKLFGYSDNDFTIETITKETK